MTPTNSHGSAARRRAAASAAEDGSRPTLFFCCATADRDHRATLTRHLSGLLRERLAPWNEDDIPAGAEHDHAATRALDQAAVVVLLVSADLLASTRHREREMRRALERHARGEALVIPVILRACDWEQEPFAMLQALPRTTGTPAAHVPILSAPNVDEAFTAVAREIRAAVEAFTPSPAPQDRPSPAAREDPSPPAREDPSPPAREDPSPPAREDPSPVAQSTPSRPDEPDAPREHASTPAVPAPSPGRRATVYRVLVAGALLAAAGAGIWKRNVFISSWPPPPEATSTTPAPTTPAPPSSPAHSPSPPSGPALDTKDAPPPTSPADTRPPAAGDSAPAGTPGSPDPGGGTAPPPAPGREAESRRQEATPPTATPQSVAASGTATCNGTLCTLSANGAVVNGTRFCLNAPASADDLEDLKPTCSRQQTAPGADVTCVRTGQAAAIELKGAITWRTCP